MEQLEDIIEQSSFSSYRQLMYNLYKEVIASKEDYQFTLKNYKSLNEHIISIKELKKIIPSITYRKINDWESKKFIDFNRKNDASWRKLSLFDIIKINIINDLRRFGYNTKNIKLIMKDISDGFYYTGTPFPPKIKDDEIEKFKRKFLFLEHFTLSCILGNKILLLIDHEGFPFLLPEITALSWISMISEHSPLLALPFFSYIKKVYSFLDKEIEIKKDSTLTAMLNETTSFKEEKILEMIKNNKYSEILIKKLNNDGLLIKSKSKISGKLNDKEIIDIIHEKDYQNITVIQENGEPIYLVQEERFKL